MDDKNDRYIVNGAHDAARLQELLDGFIKKFVLCGSCDNPETDLIIKNGDVTKKCMACGKSTPVDMRHKLVTFILKNPPPESVKHHSKAQKAVKKRGPQNGSGSPTSETPATPTSEQPEDGEDDDVMVKEAAQLVVGDDSDGEWSQDVSAAAIAARQKANLTGAISKLALGGDDDDDEDEEGNPLDAFGDFVKADTSDADILAKAKELKLKDDKALVVLSQVLFDADVEKQLPKRRALLSKLLSGDRAEKAQKAFLGGLERLVGDLFPEELMGRVPRILKAVYDLDLVEEEIMLAWGDKPSSKYVKKVGWTWWRRRKQGAVRSPSVYPQDISKEIRKKAEPFLKWLREAEEETDSDDEEDEDEEDDE